MSSDTAAVDGTGIQYINGEHTARRPTARRSTAASLPSCRRACAVGAVSTTRVGHATPATTYAHICNRNGYNTIAEQSTPGHANYNPKLARRHRRADGRRPAQRYLAKSLNRAASRTDNVTRVAARRGLQAGARPVDDAGARCTGCAVVTAATGTGAAERPVLARARLAYELDAA